MPIRFGAPRGAGVISLRSYLRGPQGEAATVEVGNVTTLAPGATPTVTNSGTNEEAVLDFGLPTTPTIEVISTTTLPAGSSATVTNAGTSSEIQLAFGIPRGADASFKWLYESSTSMAAPDVGGMRFNNATLGSVTAIAINAQTADSGNPDQSAYIVKWDDSTSAPKAYVEIREEAGSSAVFDLSSVTDNSTWLQLDVTYVSGDIDLTEGDALYFTPHLVGNKGTDGAGTGDVTAASAFGNGDRLIRSDGADKGVQASGITVDDSDNVSGVATLSATSIELGHESDTTITRSSAGKVAIEGNLIAAIADPNADRVLIWDDSAGDYVAATLQGPIEISDTTLRVTEIHGIAASDEATALTTGTNKATFSLPYAFTVTSVYATLNTASGTGGVTIGINEAGSTILSTDLTIDEGHKTSATATTPAVISDASIAANAEIGIDIDGAGSGAKGLKVFIQGYRS